MLLAVDGQQARVSQLDGDQYVQHDDDRHRQYEEQDGRDLERVLDQRPPSRAPGAVQDNAAVADVFVNDAELDGLRHGETEGQQPDHHHEFDGSGQIRHSVRDEGMTDRHVSGENKERRREIKKT